MSVPGTVVVNFSSNTPAAPTGQSNVVFQTDGGVPLANISAFDLLMVGDAGSGGYSGNVPAPNAGDAAAGKFLKADGTWAVPAAASGFTSGNNASGYWVKDPAGHIHQWGVAQAGTTPQSVTFPTAFTNASSVAVVITGAAPINVYLTNVPTVSGFSAQTNSQTCTFMWMADGY
jgi:hypothetical protein